MRTIDTISIGESASFSKTISEADVYMFAGVTGDLNPAHVNEVASSKTPFGGRIAHGMLSAGFISAVMAMQLPGPGTIYISQELKFTKPVRIGDTVTATCTVMEKDEVKNRLKMETICTNQNGDVVVKGMAIVMPPKA